MRYLLLLVFYLLSFGIRAEELPQDMHESVATIDVKVKDSYDKEETGKVVITQYKPDGKGPFPIVIMNHGRSSSDRGHPLRVLYIDQAHFFTERGFTVFVPTRIGYGAMATGFDPENSGSCNNRNYNATAEASSTEILAALDYAKQQPDVDPTRVVIIGVSVGGFATTASAAKNPSGLVAAINFAGGAGGDPVGHPGIPCQGNKLEDMYSHFGSISKSPMLWIYAENDLYFNPTYSQAWHAAFVKAGGNAEYHLMPPFGKNGHVLFSKGMDIWSPIVSQFLGKLGFPEQPLAH